MLFNYGWKDGDESNIDRVGHRRWCLNPSMEKQDLDLWMDMELCMLLMKAKISM